MSVNVTAEDLDRWASDPQGPVALHLVQKLVPIEQVEGYGGVLYPPTYADIGYNIDTLRDGTRVATVDSVGSQANRLEPMFQPAGRAGRDGWLVPPITIKIREEPCGECDACKSDAAAKKKPACSNPTPIKRSLLDLAHRAADAVVQASPKLNVLVAQAFAKLKGGDAGPICKLAPTSLVFGVWDSRGGSGEKRPRLVRSIIRAWDVEPLHAAAQFNSGWKSFDDDQKEDLEKHAKAKKIDKLSEYGLKDAPSVFRAKVKVAKVVDQRINPEARVLGGVLVRGDVIRHVTLNLVALRGLHGANAEETHAIRRYLLGLSLVAATRDIDLFLREGCLLRCAEARDQWKFDPRRGEAVAVEMEPDAIERYAAAAAAWFRPHWAAIWPDDAAPEYSFDIAAAKKLLEKKQTDGNEED